MSDIDVVDLCQMAAQAVGTETKMIAVPTDGSVPVLVTDQNRKVQSASSLVAEFEKVLPAPRRRRGTFFAADVASLLAWMNLHCTPDAPIFGVGLDKLNGEWRKPDLSFIGIGNYSNASIPAWHDFRTVYRFPVSHHWATWAKFHSDEEEPHWFSQAEFAEFIERHIYDISAPRSGEALSEAVTRFIEASGKSQGATPSQLFKFSRELEVYSSSKVETRMDLQSGEAKLHYSEEHSGPGGVPVSIPSMFYIRIPVFFGQPEVLIGVKLRYRAKNGAVSWSYSLFAPDVIVADEFKKACSQVTAASRTLYLGSPDSPQ